MLKARNQRGVIAERQGLLHEAIELLRSVLEEREIILGYSHPDTILTLVLLGIALCKKGEVQEISAITRRVNYFAEEFTSVYHRIYYEQIRFIHWTSKADHDSFGYASSDLRRMLKQMYNDKPAIAQRLLMDSDFAEHHEMIAKWRQPDVA